MFPGHLHFFIARNIWVGGGICDNRQLPLIKSNDGVLDHLAIAKMSDRAGKYDFLILWLGRNRHL